MFRCIFLRQENIIVQFVDRGWVLYIFLCCNVQVCSLQYFSIQRDLDALGQKVNVISEESARLCHAHLESHDHIKEKEEGVFTVWTALVKRSKIRKDKLVQAEQLQRFLNTFRDLRYIHVHV